MENRKFDIKDINLIPKLCIVDSRAECDTKVKFGNNTFNLPIIPANMESVIDENLAIKLAQEGYFYVMHRFNINITNFIKTMKSLNLIISISIGVNTYSYDLIEELKNNDLIPDYITIDIAHGHSLKLKRMLEYIKKEIPKTFVIAGNVGTEEGAIDLDNWGADAIKVGIGPGSACTTFPVTGFGTRNMQGYIIDKISKVTNKPIIADGGVTNPSDITKYIVLGSTMVMVGGMLSSFIDSPGKTIEKDGVLYKSFHGSASMHQSDKKERIEGTVKLNKLNNMTILEYMSYLKECLQSSISYGGGNKLSDLYLVDWI
jgi:GMP reductase